MLEKLEAILHKYEDISMALTEPDVASNPDRFRKLMKEQSDLMPLVETYLKYKDCLKAIDDSEQMLLTEDDAEMKELLNIELESAKEEKPSLENQLKILLLPKDPNDDKNVIIEIRAGVGGDEAALFAADLYRMYVKYSEHCGYSTSLLSLDTIGIGGMKMVSFMISGNGAYSKFKYESGVHRVQRVPETESGGRIHTSTATVAVMPEVTDDIEIEIPPEDVRMDITRASGNGGQGVNTTDSAVRLTHLPTGIVIYSQTERSQLQNKNKAWALLKAKLYDMKLQEMHDSESELRRSQVGTGDRSEKIRTYNFPQGRVTDHRIKLTLHKIDQIIDGDLDEIVDALRTADQAAKLLKMNNND